MLSLTFDDVALVPQFNNVSSRLDPSLETWITKNISVKTPLIPANMSNVISVEMARVLIENGGVPIFHRFAPLEEQIAWVEELKGNLFVSIGVGENEFENAKTLLDKGALGVCIDIAHGHDFRVIDLIKKIKSEYPDKDVIAGNICTARAYTDLVASGADGVKVGIGPGAACSTRVTTGFGIGQFSAIESIAQEAKRYRVPIIADGGIRNSADVTKALAIGASTVMCGKLFSKCQESSAEKKDGLVNYRGQASKEFQDDFRGGLKKGTVPEGVSFWTPISGTTQELLDKIHGGVRSGMTYGGARSIKELQRKVEYRIVHNSESYSRESNPRTD